MDSRLANGRQQTYVSVKSAHEAQAETPQLTSPMLAFAPHHEKKRKGGSNPSVFPIHFATGCTRPCPLQRQAVKRQTVSGAMDRELGWFASFTAPLRFGLSGA